MAVVAAQLRGAQVRYICLAHGTWAGTDPVGLARTVGRFSPAFRQALEGMFKGVFDAAVQEIGNFTTRYQTILQHALNAQLKASERPIEVRRRLWSGENLHVARADAAVRWIDELHRLPRAPRDRVLVIGHSHAGNAQALVSQLVAGDRARLAEFVEAMQRFYEPCRSSGRIAPWQRFQRLLADNPRPFADFPVDMVTWGTPIRYGWDPLGYARLLHFVFHYPHPASTEPRALFPPRFRSWPELTNGDFTQQVGIAGTDSGVLVPGSGSWHANRRLAKLLENDVEPRGQWERWRRGPRVPDSGTTLLVDYGMRLNLLFNLTATHTFYTRRRWMLWHLEEITRQFYGDENG